LVVFEDSSLLSSSSYPSSSSFFFFAIALAAAACQGIAALTFDLLFATSMMLELNQTFFHACLLSQVSADRAARFTPRQIKRMALGHVTVSWLLVDVYCCQLIA